MKEKMTIYHITWYIAIVLTIFLVITKSTYWYIPMAIYFTAAIGSIFLVFLLNGKIRELPICAKEALKITMEKHRKRIRR